MDDCIFAEWNTDLAEATADHRDSAAVSSIGHGEWAGVRAEVVEIQGPGSVLRLLPPSDARLVVMLEEIGGRIESRLQPARPNPSVPHRLTFAPPGIALWQYADHIDYARALVISFDPNRMRTDWAELVERTRPSSPLTLFSDPAIWVCGELIARECLVSEWLGQVFCESLAAILVIRLLRSGLFTEPERLQGGLAPWRLNRVTKIIAERLAEPLPMTELAAIAGMSQSHFSRSFKQSTGFSPNRWRLKLRIEMAKRLLDEGLLPIAEIADAVGCADQSHLTRLFSSIVGTTPARWQQRHRR